MKIVRSGEAYTSYGNLAPGKAFDYEGRIYMVMDETNPDTAEKTYTAINLETGAVTLTFSNNMLVGRISCEVKVKYESIH